MKTIVVEKQKRLTQVLSIGISIMAIMSPVCSIKKTKGLSLVCSG